MLGLRGRGVRVAFGEAAEAGLLPAVFVLLLRPGPGAGALLLVVGVGGADGGELVVAVALPVVLVAVAAVLVAPVLVAPVVLAAVLVAAVLLPVLVPSVLLPVLFAPVLLFVAGLGRGRGRGGFADGVVDGDRDPDRPAAFPAEGFADQWGEAAFEDLLAVFVGNREEGGVGDEGERLAALDPLLVFGFDPLRAVSEQLVEDPWPHCGKIGRYVSHRARSLTGPTNVWFFGTVGTKKCGVKPR